MVFCTCPDQATAMNIANTLVTKKQVACANILPSITSVFSWQEQVETAEEHMLLLKTTDHCYPAVEQEILTLHPYELPEIVSVTINQGLPEYLQWIDACLPIK